MTQGSILVRVSSETELIGDTYLSEDIFYKVSACLITEAKSHHRPTASWGLCCSLKAREQRDSGVESGLGFKAWEPGLLRAREN